MGTVDDFIEKIKQNEGYRFDKQVAEIIGVDKASLANAKVRNKLPNSYVMWYCQKYNITLKEFDKDIKLTNNKLNNTGEEKMHDFAMSLAKDKIQALEMKIDTLQNALESKQAESTHWNNLNFDYIATVQLTIQNFKMSRKITQIDNLDIISKYLGYSEEKLLELWQVNQSVLQNDWLINQIIDKSSLNEINKIIKSLPQVFDTVKNMVGNHYIPVPILYIHKDGHRVPAISYNKVVWRDMIVFSKVEFIITN